MRLRDWDRNLKIRLFGEALMNITYWMFFPFLTIYFADEFGKEQAGFLLVFSQVFSVMANLMGGYCADRFGRKRCSFSLQQDREYPFSYLPCLFHHGLTPL